MSGAGLTPMVDSDARAVVPGAMRLGARAVDIIRFVARPTYAAQPMVWGRAAAAVLASVLALDLGVDAFIAALIEAWDGSANVLPARLDQEATLAEDLLSFLLIAPVLEELMFRGWLTGRIAALRFAVYGFAALGLLTVSLYVPVDYAMPLALAGAAIAFAGLIHWNLTRGDTAVPAWFTRHFHWIVWGSSLVFGLIHLGNYEAITHPLGLLVVLPQTIGGLLLAYTRTRLGLGAAMAHHAAYNAVFLASDYGWW